MDEQTNKPTRELDKDLSLDSNELDDLDSESDNPDHADNPLDIGKGSEPISFRECCKFSNGSFNVELYSSCTSTERLAEVCLWLIQNVQSNKSPPNYTN